MRSFEEMRRDYARLSLVNGLGFAQKPRPLFVTAEIEPHCTSFLQVLAEEAFKLGAPSVDIRYGDPRVLRHQFRYAPEEFRLYVPPHVTRRAEELVARDGANLAVYGLSELGVFEGLDPKYPNSWRAVNFEASRPFTERQRAMLQPWNVIAVPTEVWAHKLGMSIPQLWETLFGITGADQADPLAYMSGVVRTLRQRIEALNSLSIRTLHFEGDGTDLMVGLSDRAVWLGGAKVAEDGTHFVPNWPTYEVFTTPDWRTVEGQLRTTMPIIVGGTVVDGLRLAFSEGRIISVDAKEGADAYRAMIGHDAGAAQLGEVALVGMDSPVAKLGRFFWHTLLDENCRSHVATGSAYSAALRSGGKAFSADELEKLGCNRSDTHTDIMISDRSTNIRALRSAGEWTTLIERGYWTQSFA